MTSSGTVLVLSQWFEAERIQQLMSRGARSHRVVVFTQPIYDADRPELAITTTDDNVMVAVPHLPADLAPETATAACRDMIDRLLDGDVSGLLPVLWYCTPTALPFTHHVLSRAVVYDCNGTPPEECERDALLLHYADVVFRNDAAFEDLSWDRRWFAMWALVERAIERHALSTSGLHALLDSRPARMADGRSSR